MVELPKTQEELDALVNQKIEEVTKNLSSKFNDDMAKLRTSHKDEIEKLKKQNQMSAEEKAKELAREKEEATLKELEELKNFKKTTTLKERLAKEGMPSYFANDNRLLNAEEGNFEKALKDVKKEYEDSLPKGNQHSSVVQINSQAKPTAEGKKEEAYRIGAEALKDLFD